MKFPKNQVTLSFILISITAPIAGVLIGGVVVYKFFGGYDKKKSILFVCVLLAVACGSTIPIYFLNDIYSITACLWSLLFFGSMNVPTLQGITICSLPPNLKASGNSVTNLMIFTLGYALGPIFYGGIYESLKLKDDRLPFVISLSFGFISLIFAILCAYFRYNFIETKKYSYKTNTIEVKIDEDDDNQNEFKN